MLKPRRLRTGDRLAVVAPASPFDPAAFTRGLAELRTLGFEPVYDERIFERRGYVAGEAGARADALMTAWRDRSIAGVLTARGGYGSAQVLPFLDPAVARAAPKPFVGFSDLTALLIFLTQRCEVVAFHGPTVAGRLSRGAAGYDAVSLRHLLTQGEPAGEIEAPGAESLKRGEARGPLLGGTLTQILASLATPFAFAPPAGYILLLDEVGERPYRLDRMLTQLRQSGLLGRAAGIVCGELPRCDEPGGAVTARAVVADLLADFPGPVLYGFPTGHTEGPAVTLPLGVETRIIAAARTRLVIEEAAVS